MILVGYGDTSKGYRMMDSKTQKVELSRDVKFIENVSDIMDDEVASPEENEIPINIGADCESEPKDIIPLSDEDNSPGQNTSQTSDNFEPEAPSDTRRRRGRPRKTDPPVVRPTPTKGRHEYNLRERNNDNLGVLVDDEVTPPKDFKDAISSSNSDEWMEALETEMASLKRNKTWDLVN